MSRAAVIYKTKDELATLSAAELARYIEWLKVKASTLGTLPRKSVEKKIAVAEKIYEQYIPLEDK